MLRHIYVENNPDGTIQVRTVLQPSPSMAIAYFGKDAKDDALAYANNLWTPGTVIVSTLGMTEAQRQAKRDRDARTLAALVDLARQSKSD